MFIALLLALAVTASGFHGVVMRGPVQPVCKVGQPCSEPAKGATLVFSHAGHVVARVHVADDGHYAVHLASGYYDVRTAVAHPVGRGIMPQHVHVARGVYGRLDFEIDTGIR